MKVVSAPTTCALVTMSPFALTTTPEPTVPLVSIWTTESSTDAINCLSSACSWASVPEPAVAVGEGDAAGDAEGSGDPEGAGTTLSAGGCAEGVALACLTSAGVAKRTGSVHAVSNTANPSEASRPMTLDL